MKRQWSDVESDLASVANDFSVFSLLDPTNEEEQRRKFEEGEIENPDFQYPEADIDLDSRIEEIQKIQIPEGEFTEQFFKRVKRQENRALAVKHRGTPQKIREASRGIYGAPEPGLIPYAHEILENIQPRDNHSSSTQADVISAIEEGLSMLIDEYGENSGFEQWNVVRDDSRNNVYTSRSKRELKVGDRDFHALDPRRIAIHELGRHAILKDIISAQKEQGNNEALRHFRYDSETEEGITTNLERITNTENPYNLRKYALRALAVDSVETGNTFRETYERLADWEDDEDLLWETTLRAHRGGGFVKDHIYLQGRKKVGEHLENGGSLKPLYIGKVPLDSVDKAREMLEDGDIDEPAYSPTVLDSRIRDYWEQQ